LVRLVRLVRLVKLVRQKLVKQKLVQQSKRSLLVSTKYREAVIKLLLVVQSYLSTTPHKGHFYSCSAVVFKEFSSTLSLYRLPPACYDLIDGILHPLLRLV